MGNFTEPMKDKIEKISLEKDIQEREQIINRYLQTGYLDRGEAIKKIVELRRNAGVSRTAQRGAFR